MLHDREAQTEATVPAGEALVGLPESIERKR